MEDNGRGIPVDTHKDSGRSAAEVIMCELHSGGKFDNTSYKVSGGLHGVGVSVVNFLSEWLRLEIRRDGGVWEQEFRRGVPVAALKRVGNSAKNGTVVTFKPDPEIFSIHEFHHDLLVQRLRELAFLNPGLTIRFHDERNGAEQEFQFRGGIAAFVEYLNRAKNTLHSKPIQLLEANADGEEVAIALQWHDGYNENVLPFTNTVYNGDGGTHLSGFRSALTRTINSYGQANNLLKNLPEGLSGEDVREGLTGVLSVKIRDPKFSSQTKDKLVSSQVKGWVESVVEQPTLGVPRGEPSDRAADRRQVRRGRAGPRSRPQGPRVDPPKRGSRIVIAPRQARGLPGEGPGGRGDLHGRGRLGRRLRQARARPALPGDPAAARQDPERGEGPLRQDVVEPGDSHASSQRSAPASERGLRRREAALPQGHHHDRRRCRRRAHPHAAADVLLPPHARS